jgi:glycosyltransferase involved in cell wall biosynthesis
MISTLNLAKYNGGTVHFNSLAKGFRMQGHQVDAILSTPYDSNRPGFSGHNLKHAIADQYFDHVTFTSPLLSRLIPFSKTTVNSLLQVLPAVRVNAHDYDWVYLRSTPLSIFVLWALRLRGFKKIFVEHNGWFSDELVMMGVPDTFQTVIEKLQTTEAHLATQLRVVVPGIQEQLLARSKQPEQLKTHLLVIGNGADIDHYYPIDRTVAMKTVGLDPEKFYLGFIGDLDPWQGVETAIRAMSLIRVQSPNTELLVVGAGRQLDYLKTTYGELNYIHFLGSVSYADSNLYINCFDIALLPKQGLGSIGYSPIKLYTYAAAGRTILASKIRGIEEYGGEGGFITLHQPGDTEDLAQKAHRLITDPDRCNRNAIRARQHAEAYFSWQRVADKITQAMQTYDAANKAGRVSIHNQPQNAPPKR